MFQVRERRARGRLRLWLLGLFALTAAGLLLATPAASAKTFLPIIVASPPTGDVPALIAVNPLTNRVYIANQGGGNPLTTPPTQGDGNGLGPDTLTVVDGSTDTTIASVTVGDHPSGVAVNDVTNKIYVGSTTEGRIYVIDGDALAADPAGVACPVAVGMPNTPACSAVPLPNIPSSDFQPNASCTQGIAGAPTTTCTYPTVSLQPPPNFVVDGCPFGGTFEPLTTFPRRLCPGGVTIDQTTGLVYVAAATNFPAGNVGVQPTHHGYLAVLDPGTNQWISMVDAGISPTNTAVDPVAHLAYVNAFDSAKVTAVSTSPCCTKVMSIPTATQPHAIGVDPNNHRLYVAHFENRTFEVFNAETGKLLKNMVLGGDGKDPLSGCPFTPFGIRACGSRNLGVNPVTGRVYVGGIFDGVVYVIQGGANKLLGAVTLISNFNAGPRGVTVNPVTNKIYVGDTAYSTRGGQPFLDGKLDQLSVLFDKHGADEAGPG